MSEQPFKYEVCNDIALLKVRAAVFSVYKLNGNLSMQRIVSRENLARNKSYVSRNLKYRCSTFFS